MKNINIRVMDYVTLVQANKISVSDVPEDIKADVIELVSYFQKGEAKEVGVTNEQH